MVKFFKKWWQWICGATIMLFGFLIYVLTRKKPVPDVKEPVLEMHNEALDIIVEISEKEYEEIQEALNSEDPENDLAARINSSGGPL